MANSIDLDQTAKKEWQIVQTLIRLSMAKSGHSDQIAENVKHCRL